MIPEDKGRKLDKLLSTADNGFNRVIQAIIWEHTHKGEIFPEGGIIEYMEILHNVFFFCSDNYKTPYACIDHLSEFADNDAELLYLIDNVLHLISQSDKGEDMTILFGQLVDLRHELAPWDEDENVKAIMKEMEKTELQTVSQSPPSASDSQRPGFDTYIDEKHRSQLIDCLVNYYTNRKPEQYGFMLYALVDLGYIPASTLSNNKTALHRALQTTFGTVGTRQNLNVAINRLDAKEINAEDKRQISVHKQQIVNFLGSLKTD